ncbi:MAG: bifunctional UDP-N-acetylmuramoyl-tripeptide:D-alanyl-D-alanine ligase/alanine racemase [Chitinophagales bacterium]
MAGVVLQSGEDSLIEYLITDSRKLIFPETSLFFALRGPRRDGTQYVQDLYERGIRNFVVHKKIQVSEYPGANFILVKDSLQALQSLAAFRRGQFNIPVIGISGSNGKTIVKEWLNQMLEDRYSIVRSPKSYNSQIGVPLSVWQMSDTNELGIFEAGISKPGEMKKLEPIIRPSIGIFTNIGEAHSEGFSNISKKVKEKLELFRHAAVLIYCKDHLEIDRTIAASSGKQNPKLLSWGKHPKAWLRILSLVKGKDQTSVKLKWEGNAGTIKIRFTDSASIENAITAVCTLLHLGLDLNSIQNKLQALSPVAMRLEWQHGINHCSIINDSYSADLSSLKIALDFLSQQKLHPKRTIILSDILESGKDEKKLYREVALLLAHNKINRLLAIGQKITANAEIFTRLMKGEQLFFDSTDQFIKAFHQLHFKDETILIKGARIFGFEKIDRLLAQQAHQTRLEINLTAMVHNLKQYQQLLKPTTRIMAMVKAFAYGAGSYEIASLLQFQKIDYLAVAYTDEAVDLRKAGITLPVMVMNAEENDLEAIFQYNLEPVIYSFPLLDAIHAFVKKEGIKQMPVHIEIESGMNRLGFAIHELNELISRLMDSACKVQSVFSHLAASEEKEQDTFTRKQFKLFQQAAGKLQASIPYPFLRHIANSAAIIRHPDMQLDMVRLGIGLYGIDSANAHRLDLKEVATLKSKIAQVKTLEKGETVGYNRKGVADQKKRIATVRIGYADGIPEEPGQRCRQNACGRQICAHHRQHLHGHDDD